MDHPRGHLQETLSGAVVSLNDWYPFNVVEYRRDTYHLNVTANGIYRALIDEYMLTGKPLPDHEASLVGISRATQAEWAAHKETVMAFFKARDGKLYHKRCEQELDAQRMHAALRSKKAKEAATVRWGNEKQKQKDVCRELSIRTANAMLNDARLHNNIISPSTVVVEDTGTSEKRISPMLVASAELAASLRRKA